MSDLYLDMSEIAVMAGITVESVRHHHQQAIQHRNENNPHLNDLPAPAVIIGSRTPAARPGWSKESITQWLAANPNIQ